MNAMFRLTAINTVNQIRSAWVKPSWSIAGMKIGHHDEGDLQELEVDAEKEHGDHRHHDEPNFSTPDAGQGNRQWRRIRRVGRTSARRTMKQTAVS